MEISDLLGKKNMETNLHEGYPPERAPEDFNNGSVGRRAITIGTIVVRGGPIQMVIALLQSGDAIHIKVVELEPKITTLADNIDEAVGLQREHDEILKQLQGLPTPVEEFVRKADNLLASKRINSHVSDAMGQALSIIWEDILKLIHDRKMLIDLCTNFHEKMGTCRGRMASLEVACKDTMIPIEVEAVQDFLTKFKQLRIDVLSIIMSALKEGNALLAKLQDLVKQGTLDTRPEHIRRDTMRAVSQVQQWLENLHDRRAALEVAWQTRKTQLEQCLALAILSKDLDELENILMNRKNDISSAGIFTLGECEHTSNVILQEYIGLKHDALLLRDRALKITRTTEKLINGSSLATAGPPEANVDVPSSSAPDHSTDGGGFVETCITEGEGNYTCSKRAYQILSECTEYLELMDQREHWLNQSKDFFIKADKTLNVLEKLEVEISNIKLPENSPEIFSLYSKILKDLRSFTEEPLRLGYSILDEVGRTIPETQGVKRVLDEIENRKIYIEGICSAGTEEQVRITEALNLFFEQHNEILSWLVSVAEEFLKGNNSLGGDLTRSRNFLNAHHRLMQDLEIRGERINFILENIKRFLHTLSPQQKYDVDTKAEALHKHWIELKELILKRVDLVSLYIEFLEKARNLSQNFDEIEFKLKETPQENKLQYLESLWTDIKGSYGNLKACGMRFLNTKVADPYLETKSACSTVEEILNSFSNRQFDITSSWEKWTTDIIESKEIQLLIERIMNEQIEILKKATTLDTQLYPVFQPDSDDPKNLKATCEQRLENVIQDIQKAQDELTQRMTTTNNVQTEDEELKGKIGQVIENLKSLQAKLENIKIDYRSLIGDIMRFLDDIIELRSIMDKYFMEKENEKQQQLKTSSSAMSITNGHSHHHDQYQQNAADDSKSSGIKYEAEKPKRTAQRALADHESFRENCMDKFRSLIAQSEKLIDRVRTLEPPVAREHDTDRILKLLENLRIHFESNNNRIMTDLQKSQNLSNFEIDLNEINENLDKVEKQLRDIREQKIENPSLAKTTSLAFEYFERTVELLEKRIENFIKSSGNLCTTNPESETYVKGEVDKLQSRWEKFKGQVKLIRNSLNLSKDYYELYSQVESKYRELVSFHSSVINKIPSLSSAKEAENYINIIEEYLNPRQQPLNDDLIKLRKLSLEVYDEDRTGNLQNDIKTLLCTYEKLRVDAIAVVERFRKEEEKAKELERKQSQQELEQQQHLKISSQQLQPVEHNITEKQLKTEITTVFSEVKYSSPRFVRTLTDASIGEGERLTFDCEVIGNPEPNIEWFKDGISIQNNPDYKTFYDHGICTLLIEETFAADTANFSCRASNLVGSDETIAKLTVREPEIQITTATEDDGDGGEEMVAPRFVEYLQSGQAKEGSSFEFRCVATGNPLPTAQWFKDGKCIEDSPDYIINYNNGEAKLRLEKVYLEDRGIFTCKVTNPVGFEQCAAKLIVEPLEPTEEPHFKIHLSNVMARVGQKLKLECIVTGIPTPELFWTHNGKPYKGYSDLRFEDERVTLIISEAYPKDSGVYILTARNLAGETHSSCNVTVKGRLPNETSDSEMASDIEPIKPSVQLALKDTAVFEGKPVRLDCIIIGQPEPEVIWYHDNRPVKESADVQLLFQGDRCTLIIQEAYLEDAGSYKVVAINSAGEASSSCTLSVTPLNSTDAPITRFEQQQQNEKIQINDNQKPKFEKFLSDVLAAEGDTVELECSVHMQSNISKNVKDGKPDLEVKWFLSNKEIIETDHVKFSTFENGSNILKLIIKNVSVNDKGVYTVKISNGFGDAKCFSHLIVKSVNVPVENQQQTTEIEEKHVCPSFKELFCDRYFHLGDLVKFECIITGKPQPKAKWLFNGEPVHGKNFLISTSGDRQVLTIPSASQETIGKISCVAENEVGRATCAANLRLIEGEDGQPSNINVQSMSQEHNAESSRVTIKKQTFTTTSTSQVSTIEGNLPNTELESVAASAASLAKANMNLQEQKMPDLTETRLYTEIQKSPSATNASNEIPISSYQQKSVVLVTKPDDKPAFKLSTRKETAPRFVTPLVGKIVDQGAQVSLEAIYDGFPSPEVKIQRNGEDLFETDRVKILNKLNRVSIDLSNANVRDAGRYSITVTNTAGQSTSSADVVVKKTIFPPVFGRRLQAKVAKRGERIVMEVEVTGTPEPTVTWFKDDKPLSEAVISEHKIRNQGNSHIFIIEKAKCEDSGKYMVKAKNSAGEAQSIADFAVLEPSPEKMTEVVKTVVYDDLKDFAAQTKKPEMKSFYSAATEHKTESDLHGVAESTIITEHKCTTEATMRLEHKPTYFDIPELKNRQSPNIVVTSDIDRKTISTNTESSKTKIATTQTPPPIPQPKADADSSNIIETSSISKKSAFEYFKKIQVDPVPTTPIEEKYMKYEEYSKTPTPTFSPQQHSTTAFIPKTVFTATKTDMSIPTKFIPIQKEESSFTSSLTEEDMIKYNLKPGTPPEICYIPKPEVKPREHISDRIKKLEESRKINVDAPQGGVQVLPQLVKKEEYTKTSSFVKEVKYESSSTVPKTIEIPISRPQAVLPSPQPAMPQTTITQPTMTKPTYFPPPIQTPTKETFFTSPNPFEHSEYSQSHEYVVSSSSTVPDNLHLQEQQVLEQPKPQSIKETKKIFEQKIQQQSTSTWSSSSLPSSDLKSPHLVKQTVHLTKQSSTPKEDKILDIHLQPGTPPEICFAPISNTGSTEERRPSLVETMEKALEENLKTEPRKVLPYSVRTIPPPPPPTSSVQKDVPPPLPPKDFQVQAPPIPARSMGTESTTTVPTPAPTKFIKSTSFEQSSSSYKQSESSVQPPTLIRPVRFTPTRAKSADLQEQLKETPRPLAPSEFENVTKESYSKKYESSSSYRVQESKKQIFETKEKSFPSFKTKPSTAEVPQNTFLPTQTKYAPSKQQPHQKDHLSSQKTYLEKTSTSQTTKTEFRQPKTFPVKVPPTPSPSKFMRSEFRESDYCSSDYDEKIQPLWKPYESTDAEVKGYRSVRPNLTPTVSGRPSTLSEEFRSPIPPSEFEQPSSFASKFDNTSRPKFEPIKQEAASMSTQTQSRVYKPKPVSAKFMESSHTATPQKSYTTQYYTAIAGVPMHHASMATETRNTMQMKESTEKCHRIVNMSQTKRIIHFDEMQKQRSQEKLEPFPYSPSPAFSTTSSRHHTGPTPTPTKFVPGEFRESDYDSEVENAKIRPLWTPNESDYEGEPRFRHVDPPYSSRSMSLPRSYERIISPLEFDTVPPEMPTKIPLSRESSTFNRNSRAYRSQTVDRGSYVYPSPITKSSSSTYKTTRDDMNLKVGSPPKFGYVQEKTSHFMKDFNSTLHKKTTQFMNNVSNDLKKTTQTPYMRPEFKRAPSEGHTNKPQAYREESRLSQYGTKHIDPDTGLIYFKYDFGYEFGIIFPGEGKKFIGGSTKNNKLAGNMGTGSNLKKYPPINHDIIIPVQHERTIKNGGFNRANQTPTPKSFPSNNAINYNNSKQHQNGFVTSDSEFSETEYESHAKKRYSLPVEINIDEFHRNDHNFTNGRLSATDQSGYQQTTPVNSQQNREERPKKAPIFITPLKDIAVVIGQTARFECIVQCDPHPNIIWAKNGFPLRNSNKHIIEFRNGVCRLTIPEAYPDDAGNYSCTGTNELGSTTTSAELIVPGNRLGVRY